MHCWHPGKSDDVSDADSFMEPENGDPRQALETKSSLEGLQSAEQRNVLNIVDQLRKCGLESTLSLPQLVFCGDQSAGKSSVLEALTEVPFPRNDNLCTRFATEIILRRAPNDAITITVIPDNERPREERDHIEAFKESISDFGELPSLMDKATTLMGINDKSTSKSRATKPDRLPSGSGSERAFIGLARNEDIFFQLGWHVLKNRSYEEGSSSFEQRNVSEISYFRKSNFSSLSTEYVGITSLRDRLSQLLFDHVKQELPKLRKDLEEALADSQLLLGAMGDQRATPQDCKAFLTQLSLEFYEVGKAAVNGHYEGEYFAHNRDQAFSVASPTTIRRLRAVIQYKNSQFSNLLRTRGYKYHIDKQQEAKADGGVTDEARLSSEAAKTDMVPVVSITEPIPPIHWSEPRAIEWVRKTLVRIRGKELPGNFNPLLVGELFWEQSSKW